MNFNKKQFSDLHMQPSASHYFARDLRLYFGGSEISKMNKLLLSFTFVTLFLFSQIANSQQITEEWSRHYNSTNVDNGLMVETKDNYIYVCGVNSSNIFLIKYNSMGDSIWTRHYDGGGSDYPHDMYISNDRIYITGQSFGTSSGIDAVTLCYDINGNQKYASRYTSPGTRDDVGLAITALNGNVYITGYTSTDSTGYDILTISYNSTGMLRWTKIKDGTLHNYDRGKAISVLFSWDTVFVSDVSILVAGVISDTVSLENSVVISYDTTGHEQLVRRYNYNNGTDEANDIHTFDGETYITGRSWSNTTQFDAFVINYSQGLLNERFIKRFHDNKNENGLKILADNLSTSYVLINADGNNNDQDIIAVSYSNAGALRWSKRWNGAANLNDIPGDMTLNQNGIFITGQTNKGTLPNPNRDFVTLRYDLAGSFKWSAFYNAPMDDLDFGHSIAAGDDGSIYVTGQSYEGSGHDYDMVTLKYSASVGIQQTGTGVPENFSLSQNYPNPFNPATNIKFAIKNSSVVKLSVYDISGKEVAVSVNERLSPGVYEYKFDGSGLASGVYFYRLETGGFIETKKMMLVK